MFQAFRSPRHHLHGRRSWGTFRTQSRDVIGVAGACLGVQPNFGTLSYTTEISNWSAQTQEYTLHNMTS